MKTFLTVPIDLDPSRGTDIGICLQDANYQYYGGSFIRFFHKVLRICGVMKKVLVEQNNEKLIS